VDAETAVRGFVERNFLSRKGKKTLSNDESLLDSGLIDSTAIFELVGFLEKEFNIEVQDEDIVPEHFETVNNLVAFIQSRQKN